MKSISELAVESIAQEKRLIRRIWKFVAALIVAYAITVFLFMSGLFALPLLLSGLICVIDLSLAVGLFTTMADTLSELKYQNELLSRIPPSVPE
jgi:hypothetical protein